MLPSVDGANRGTMMVSSAMESTGAQLTLSGPTSSHGNAADTGCLRCKGNHDWPHTCGKQRPRSYVAPVVRSLRRRGANGQALMLASGPPLSLASSSGGVAGTVGVALSGTATVTVYRPLETSEARGGEGSSSATSSADPGAVLGDPLGDDNSIDERIATGGDAARLDLDGGESALVPIGSARHANDGKEAAESGSNDGVRSVRGSNATRWPVCDTGGALSSARLPLV